MFKWWMGPLMAAGDTGGMGGGAAVADVSSDFGGDSAPDTGGEPEGGEVHDAEFVEPGTDVAVREPGQVVKAGERAIDKGKFTASGRTAIETLRQLSPRLAQETTQALLTRDWFMREFPGGKREIAQLRELAQKNGGEQGISEFRAAQDQLQNLTDWFDAGDNRFVEALTEDDERTAAFVKLMPAMLDKLEKAAPQHYAYQQSKAFAHLLDESRMPIGLARMVDLLNRSSALEASGNHEMAASLTGEMINSFNGIVDTLNKVYAVAKTPPAAPGSVADPRTQDRERQLSQREQNLQKQEWQGSVRDERKRLFSKAWGEVTKGRNITPDQEATIKGFYELQLMAKIRNWQNQAERFLANGDKDGYLREQFGFFQKAIPEAVRQAIQKAVPAKPGPKVSTG